MAVMIRENSQELPRVPPIDPGHPDETRQVEVDSVKAESRLDIAARPAPEPFVIHIRIKKKRRKKTDYKQEHVKQPRHPITLLVVPLPVIGICPYQNLPALLRTFCPAPSERPRKGRFSRTFSTFPQPPR